MDTMERIASFSVDHSLLVPGLYLSRRDREITSLELGEMVLERLKSEDAVAYVRFASVHREFKDVETFIDEIRKLLEEAPDKN